jgi:hypothetical protein
MRHGVTAGFAGSPREDDPFGRHRFSPDVVVKNASLEAIRR